MIQVTRKSLRLVSLVIVVVSLSFILATRKLPYFCVEPTDGELVDLALDYIVEAQTGSVSGLVPEGQRYQLRLITFPDRQAFLDANPECCEVFTRQAVAEHISPAQRDRSNYSGSVRIRATYKVRTNSNQEFYPHNTYTNTRVVHVDKCRQIINL
ncbi:hypothetical protein RZ517_04900 [Roseovarius sp. S88]|uniref:Uncharacterized protein n=1 Tax=Roseovarius phycicola TaxID=3080976 RepID=A0ABZ2HHK2_9RHOB